MKPMDRPLISICIPTFNRCGQLEKTVQSVIRQPEFADGRAELVICDNASEDGTESCIRKIREQYPRILYSRNEKNIRDANFPNVLSLANGRLRKLNNDTLTLAPGALKMMCETVCRLDAVRPVVFWSNGFLKNPPEEMLDFRSFVTGASYWSTWIGAFSIWEEDCGGLRDDLRGCEKNLWQVRKTYELASEKNSCLIVNQKFGSIREVPGKNISYGLYRIFYENFTGFLKPYLENGKISPTDYEKVERDLLFGFFMEWMIKLERRKDSFRYAEGENLKELIENRYKDKPYWEEFLKQYRRQKKLFVIRDGAKKVLGAKR